jgi:predicted lipoprotein
VPKRSSGLSMEPFRELARTGAETTLKQLRAEIIAIERTFPELAVPNRQQIGKSVERVTRRATRMSAAARKAVSQRMKRYCTKPLRGSYLTHQSPIAA